MHARKSRMKEKWRVNMQDANNYLRSQKALNYTLWQHKGCKVDRCEGCLWARQYIQQHRQDQWQWESERKEKSVCIFEQEQTTWLDEYHRPFP